MLAFFVCLSGAGSVQVTLKSPNSVPPYRIENMCKDVVLYFIQVTDCPGGSLSDCLLPWDEPCEPGEASERWGTLLKWSLATWQNA
mgnify:CR=1 FL=1